MRWCPFCQKHVGVELYTSSSIYNGEQQSYTDEKCFTCNQILSTTAITIYGLEEEQRQKEQAEEEGDNVDSPPSDIPG